MNILIASDAWTPQVNGVVTTLVRTVECLRADGHTVTLVTPDRFAGFSTKSLDGLSLSLPPYRIGRFMAGVDAVHISTEGPLGLATRAYCERRQIPYTTAFHTNFAVYARACYKIPEAWSYRYLRWFHRNSRAIMVPTRSQIAELEDHGFANCALWGRGVDEAVFHPGPPAQPLTGQEDHLPRPFWLNVGRVSKEKNLDAYLGLALPGTKFVVGDGPDRERLQATYPEVQFLGSLGGTALGDAYRDADVFVFPSKFDTFGLVNIEAIACGTPVAAFPVTGPIDIVTEGVTGSLDGDLEAACLRALRLGRVTGNFSWDNATADFMEHLHVFSARHAIKI